MYFVLTAPGDIVNEISQSIVRIASIESEEPWQIRVIGDRMSMARSSCY